MSFEPAENLSSTPVWETQGDWLVRSLWKKSRLFYSHNIFRKNYRFLTIATPPRIGKDTWNIVKITFSCRNYHIITFNFVLFTSVANQGPSNTVAFSRITSNILKFGTGSFTVIKRNIKAIFGDYFSSLCFDSGKIFLIIIFSRGPRVTYCIVK